MSWGLSDAVIEQAHSLFYRHSKIEKALIYGSRAKGNYREGSDIDLTLFGDELTYHDLLAISDEFNDSSIPHKIDLSLYHELTHDKLKDHINSVGQIFYSRFVRLGDVCKVIAGQSPKGKYYNKGGKGLPFYQGKKEFGKVYIKQPSVWTTKVTKEAIRDDILMSVRAPVGPVNISKENICIGRGLAAIRSSEKIDKSYLFNFLLSIEKDLVGSTGAVFNSINKGQIEEIKIPLPPLPIQQKIVTKLDAIFAEIDKASAAAEANVKNAEALFQSYLRQVFDKGGNGWTELKLSEITSKIGSGATPKGGNVSYKKTGISLIRSMNVYDGGFYRANLAFIDITQAKELDNVAVEVDDVLLNITGASIARCCVVPSGILPARVNQHVSILRANQLVIDPHLLHFLLISPIHKRKLLSFGETGGTTRQALTKSQLQDYIIRFPLDRNLQSELIERVRNLLLYIRKIKVLNENRIRNIILLKQSILKQAFTGELVRESHE